MSQVLSKRFKSKYDDYLSQMQYWKDEMNDIDSQLDQINKANPWVKKPETIKEYKREAITLWIILSFIPFGVIVLLFLFWLFKYMGLSNNIQSIGVLVLFVPSCIALGRILGLISAWKYAYFEYPRLKESYDKYEQQHQKDLPQINKLKSDEQKFYSEYWEFFDQLRKFAIAINEWIHKNRKQVDVDTYTLGTITRTINKNFINWDKSKYYESNPRSPYSSGFLLINTLTCDLYRWFFNTSYVTTPTPITYRTTRATQKYTNKIHSVSIRNKYAAEIDKILAEHPWATTKIQQEAVKKLAGLNILANIDEDDLTEEERQEIKDTLHVQEEKNVVNHISYEGRISQKEKKQMKDLLGYKCMACGKDMSEIYGDIGQNYIELHHKKPYADIALNETRTLNQDDFCVLCPNCHAMIHKLQDAGDINLLSNIIKLTKDKKQ